MSSVEFLAHTPAIMLSVGKEDDRRRKEFKNIYNP